MPRVEDLDYLGKIGKRTGQPVNFVNNNRVDPPCGDIGKQPLRRRPLQCRAGEPAIIIPRAQDTQPSCRWLVMKASQAARCACSELNSCSSPSSEDLRV